MDVLKGDFLDTLYLYVCNCLEITDVCNECIGCLAGKSNGGTKLYPMYWCENQGSNLISDANPIVVFYLYRDMDECIFQ